MRSRGLGTLLLALIAMAAIAAPWDARADSSAAVRPDFYFGAFSLPKGWHWKKMPAVDSNPGVLLDGAGRKRMEYDLGGMAGFCGDPESTNVEDQHPIAEERVQGVRLRVCKWKHGLWFTFADNDNFFTLSSRPAALAQAWTIMRSFKPYACGWNDCKQGKRLPEH